MMALIGPQLTGGHFLFLCIGFIVKPWGGRGEEWVRQGSRETAAGDDTVKNIPVTDPPSTPLPPSPTPPHPHTQMLHHLLFWRFWFERHFSSSLSSKNSKASGWSLRGWQQVLLTDQLTGVSKFKTSRYSESISVSCQAWEQVSDHRGAAAPDDEKPGVTSFPNNGEHFS